MRTSQSYEGRNFEHAKIEQAKNSWHELLAHYAAFHDSSIFYKP